ncbi:hypothetical protein [Chishuiella sp.]|uniref:hypothetical protein n=1 Tax=Chishuiella sp. TaxID=1969467 RepID=UPI0028B1E8D0|nr:hypothetical protein [Chishuiella sp.]
MKPKFLSLISFFCCIFTINAQYKAPFAIIKDKDGYVNVRENSSIKSKIIDKIYLNQVFEDQRHFGSSTRDWIYISYGVKYDKKTQYFKEKTGYIYADRILYLENLPQLKKRVINKNNIEFNGNGIKMILKFGKFNNQFHIIKKSNGYVEKIDNEIPWGIDGILPEPFIEIKTIHLIINDKEFSFPKNSLQGIYQPTTENIYVSTRSALSLFL